MIRAQESAEFSVEFTRPGFSLKPGAFVFAGLGAATVTLGVASLFSLNPGAGGGALCIFGIGMTTLTFLEQMGQSVKVTEQGVQSDKGFMPWGAIENVKVVRDHRDCVYELVLGSWKGRRVIATSAWSSFEEVAGAVFAGAQAVPASRRRAIESGLQGRLPSSWNRESGIEGEVDLGAAPLAKIRGKDASAAWMFFAFVVLIVWSLGQAFKTGLPWLPFYALHAVAVATLLAVNWRALKPSSGDFAFFTDRFEVGGQSVPLDDVQATLTPFGGVEITAGERQFLVFGSSGGYEMARILRDFKA